MIDLDPAVELALLSLPDKQVFSKPMSKKARLLLNNILKWAYPHTGRCFKSSTPAADCFTAFTKEYSAIKFEDACHRFDMMTYISALNKNFKPNKAENLLKLMLLSNLDDSKWVDENNIKHNVNKVGSLKTERTIILYEWLTTYFIVTDFTEIDLNKLSALGDEKYTLQNIKDVASNISDIDKRNISYLYAIVKNGSVRDEAVHNRDAIAASKNDERLKQLFTIAGPKIQHDIQDKVDEWKREREWLDAMRDLDEKI
jgi:hypothetical protein